MTCSSFQRNTRQRKVILEELRKVKTHPTAVGLYASVRRRMPKISLGTVYRNLELLSSLGMIQKLEFGSDEARYDGVIVYHDHFRCVSCGRVEDAPGLPAELTGDGKRDWENHEVLGHRLEFFGICPKCKPRQAQ
jgi:Fe2+ or Zn2+ uptake regulation protein